MHVTIEATGGYSAPNAPLTIAIACALCVASICLGFAWTAKRYALVAFFLVTLLAAEAWTMMTTGERILVAREAAAEPARRLALDRQAAEQRLADARKGILETSPRLSAALQAKRDAEQAVLSEASKPGCASNCRALLTKAVDDAAAELMTARAELDRQNRDAQKQAEAAVSALAAMPAPKSAAPLADKLGLPAWGLDLVAAALASLAANGLGAALLIFGAHGRHRESHPGSIVSPPVAVSDRQTFVSQYAAPAAAAAAAPVPVDPVQHAARFGLECFKPSPTGRTPLRQIEAAYLDWCAARQTPPLPSKAIGSALASLIAETPGLTVEDDDSGKMHVAGLILRQEAIKAIGELVPMRA